MLEQYVKSLVHEGFTIVPPHVHNIPVTLMEAASAASIKLIKHMSEFDCTVNFTRPGEDEPDIGLIHRLPEEGKDIKYFLHTTPDFRSIIERDHELWERLVFFQREIEYLNSLYFELNNLVLNVLKLLPAEGLFLDPLSQIIQSYRRSGFRSIPNATTTLRGLWYPAKENHKGAEGHPDKGLITAHSGDSGGSLYGHREKGDGKAFKVSPDKGHILLIWGVKAPILSDGKLKPLWHSATASPGEDRIAQVLFGHVRTIKPVYDAKSALADFCVSRGIMDVDAWYEELWRE